MSQGLGRRAERTTRSCSSFTPGCSSSSSRSFQPSWLGLNPPRSSNTQSSFMSESQPKRHQLGASKTGETQDVQLKAQLPPAWAVSSSAHRRRCQWRWELPKFSAASQKKPAQSWTCSPANSTFRSSGEEKHYLTPNVGLEFLFQNEGFGEGLLSLQHKQSTTQRHIPDWIAPSLGDGIWISPLGHVSLSPWAPEHRVFPGH